MPRLSVLMAVYNGERYLDAALQSILRQTFRDFELLVVDDGSTDGTSAILARCSDPRLRVLRNETNIGLTRSLNRGLAEARGELVARHDADDMSLPERFAKQLAAFEADPELVLAGTQIRNVDTKGRPVLSPPIHRCSSPDAIRWQIVLENPFSHGTVMFRRDVVWSQLGGYDESYRTAQDFELWWRIVPRFRTRNLRETLVEVRRHAASISGGYKQDTVDRVSALVAKRLDEAVGDLGHREWLPMWCAVMYPALPGARASVAGIASTFDRLWQAYVARHPEAAHDPEIPAQQAAFCTRVACTLTAIDRGSALRLYRRALAARAPLALRSLPRFATRFMLGENGPRVWKTILSHLRG